MFGRDVDPFGIDGLMHSCVTYESHPLKTRIKPHAQKITFYEGKRFLSIADVKMAFLVLYPTCSINPPRSVSPKNISDDPILQTQWPSAAL